MSEFENIYTPNTNSATGKKIWFFIVKIAISSLLVSWIFAHTDIPLLKKLLHHTDVTIVLMSVALGAILTAIASFRWRLVANALKVRMPYIFCLLTYFEATTLNLFLPGSIGGEALRTLRSVRITGMVRPVILSVIFDRLMNLFALFILLALSFPLITKNSLSSLVVSYFVILMTVTTLCVCTVVFFPALLFRFRHHFLIREVLKLLLIGKRFSKYPKKFLAITMLSMLTQSLNILILLMCSKALSLSTLSLSDAIMVSTIAMVANSVPISFGGLGVREGAMIWVLQQIGLNFNDAFSLSILFGVVFMSQGIPGIFVWVFWGKLEKRFNFLPDKLNSLK